jgi:hypothetical protein
MHARVAVLGVRSRIAKVVFCKRRHQMVSAKDSPLTKHLPFTTQHNLPRPSAMVLKIRLARFGKRHAPFYNIVVAHARYAYNLPRATRIPTSLELHHPPRSALSPYY